jgi:hypothetical protein
MLTDADFCACITPSPRAVMLFPSYPLPEGAFSREKMAMDNLQIIGSRAID